MSQTVPSAMWPGYRGGTLTPIKRAAQRHQRDHAYHSSAKLGSHQQSRYHRYVRYAMGPRHRYNYTGDSFSKVVGA